MKDGIAIAGTIAVDEIKRVACYPDKSQLTTIQSISRSVGGAVSNCSISLARMDRELPVEAIAFIGDDEKGRFLKAQLEEYPNINLDQMRTAGDTPFTDVIQDDQDRSRTFFTYRGNSALFDEDSINFKKLNAKILHVAYILLLESLDQEDEEFGTKMARVLRQAQDHGIKTSIDIVSENSNRYERMVPPSLKYTNYCIVNEIEAGKSVDISLRDESGELIAANLKKVLVKLKDCGVKDWVVIHTPEGGFGYDGESIYSIPSLRIEHSQIKGTVGAGDAYLSGVLYGALKGMDLAGAMKLGTAAAASSLFEEDSTSGVRSYEELIRMYKEFPKREGLII
ncbi:carbohydrate kinase family protein [Cytobacillus oceanisediminis]|uniref:carbohydrate kinase family protein n=1 Tax=Cytobacillus oceanisediminis TaxID=665099 RepID=UPI00207A5E53|nr:carbohydrate kinase family protein [Cytobacillus oceanisediminis]USK44050.1 carbohydrate kinase family protein [Cytobacillus oceanisediminis]